MLAVATAEIAAPGTTATVFATAARPMTALVLAEGAQSTMHVGFAAAMAASVPAAATAVAPAAVAAAVAAALGVAVVGGLSSSIAQRHPTILPAIPA